MPRLPISLASSAALITDLKERLPLNVSANLSLSVLSPVSANGGIESSSRLMPVRANVLSLPGVGCFSPSKSLSSIDPVKSVCSMVTSSRGNDSGPFFSAPGSVVDNSGPGLCSTVFSPSAERDSSGELFFSVTMGEPVCLDPSFDGLSFWPDVSAVSRWSSACSLIVSPVFSWASLSRLAASFFSCSAFFKASINRLTDWLLPVIRVLPIVYSEMPCIDSNQSQCWDPE